MADVPIDTSGWVTSSQLVIHYAHTVEYRCDWYVGSTLWKSYDFTTCDGWISDEFISGGGEYAIVGWNLVTNAMFTESVPGHTYNNQVATDCANWAQQTIFPGANVNNIDIRP